MKTLRKVVGLVLGTAIALPLVLMFAGVMLALGGGVAGATSLRDLGGSLAAAGALGFVLLLIYGEYWSPILDMVTAPRSDNERGVAQPPSPVSDPNIFPGYRAQQVRKNPTAYGANVQHDTKERRKALSEELAKRRFGETGKGET